MATTTMATTNMATTTMGITTMAITTMATTTMATTTMATTTMATTTMATTSTMAATTSLAITALPLPGLLLPCSTTTRTTIHSSSPVPSQHDGRRQPHFLAGAVPPPPRRGGQLRVLPSSSRRAWAQAFRRALHPPHVVLPAARAVILVQACRRAPPTHTDGPLRGPPLRSAPYAGRWGGANVDEIRVDVSQFGRARHRPPLHRAPGITACRCSCFSWPTATPSRLPRPFPFDERALLSSEPKTIRTGALASETRSSSAS
ncbi:hypothetical protein RJ55_05519 [Drechmeria coniospora]|nr:hypothetical protein RJ55_05519 [Drechmeria coniospora]